MRSDLRLAVCLTLTLLLVTACSDDEFDFGSLALAGPDTALIGDTFMPTTGGPYMALLTWSGALTAIVTLTFQDDQTLTSATFRVDDPRSQDSMFGYRLICEEEPAACARISIDYSSRTATFPGVTLPVFLFMGEALDSATGPLTVTGTLMWE